MAVAVAAELTGGLILDGGMREEGRVGGRVSPDWATVINFMACMRKGLILILSCGALGKNF